MPHTDQQQRRILPVQRHVVSIDGEQFMAYFHHTFLYAILAGSQPLSGVSCAEAYSIIHQWLRNKEEQQRPE